MLGQLTAAEERELENYLNVGRTLEFLKAKARRSLRNNPASKLGEETRNVRG